MDEGMRQMCYKAWYGSHYCTDGICNCKAKCDADKKVA